MTKGEARAPTRRWLQENEVRNEPGAKLDGVSGFPAPLQAGLSKPWVEMCHPQV